MASAGAGAAGPVVTRVTTGSFQLSNLTGDVTYTFTAPSFPDYPKYGVWRDAYYISTREFAGGGGPFAGVGAYALNRTKMIAGNGPRSLRITSKPSMTGI